MKNLLFDKMPDLLGAKDLLLDKMPDLLDTKDLLLDKVPDLLDTKDLLLALIIVSATLTAHSESPAVSG